MNTAKLITYSDQLMLERKFFAFGKRQMDIWISFFLLFLLLIPLSLTALAIRFDSPGKAIFKQKRYGRNGKLFDIYKFRTLYTNLCDQGGRQQVIKNDTRVTRLGRWLRHHNLDELPQLWNVLKGDMSLVGPRPHPVDLDQFYAPQISGYWDRYHCLPGITGWAQINGWCGETMEIQSMYERVLCDLEYLQRRSLWFDLKIILASARYLLA